ncbi:MAG: hypothetical protein ABI690_10660 [Chloroflexota bacterium]
MSRYPLKITLVLVAVLMIVSVGAKAVGALQPLNPALRGFVEGCEGQPQPCWYGIVPGVTSVDEASILKQLGCTSNQGSFDGRLGIYLRYLCNANSPIYQIDIGQPLDLASTTISSITVWFAHVSVGDLVSQLGLPKHFDIDRFAYSGTYLDFGNDIYLYVDESPGKINLNTEVRNYTIGFVNNNYLFTWRGFIPFWRYCQLEPDFPDCPT